MRWKAKRGLIYHWFLLLFYLFFIFLVVFVERNSQLPLKWTSIYGVLWNRMFFFPARLFSKISIFLHSTESYLCCIDKIELFLNRKICTGQNIRTIDSKENKIAFLLSSCMRGFFEIFFIIKLSCCYWAKRSCLLTYMAVMRLCDLLAMFGRLERFRALFLLIVCSAGASMRL